MQDGLPSGTGQPSQRVVRAAQGGTPGFREGRTNPAGRTNQEEQTQQEEQTRKNKPGKTNQEEQTRQKKPSQGKSQGKKNNLFTPTNTPSNAGSFPVSNRFSSRNVLREEESLILPTAPVCSQAPGFLFSPPPTGFPLLFPFHLPSTPEGFPGQPFSPPSLPPSDAGSFRCNFFLHIPYPHNRPLERYKPAHAVSPTSDTAVWQGCPPPLTPDRTAARRPLGRCAAPSQTLPGRTPAHVPQPEVA